MFFRKTVLDNGITVISEPMDTVRSITLGIWFAVGSRDEAPSEAGMSHFMEHMMFKGTSRMSAKDISEHFDRLGAELNAFTSKEYTCYYSRFVDEHLSTAFEALGEMVRASSLEDVACEREREVVIEEIARMEDNPEDHVHELFAHTLWPEHPLGLPILGNRGTVGGFDHAQSVAFRSKHYVTGNCVVAAAGNVDHEELVRMTERFLGDLPQGPRSARPVAEPVHRPALRVIRKETEQAHICYGVGSMNARHPDRFALALLDGILGGGMSSRLFQKIREEKGLAYAVGSFSALYQDTGEFVVYAGTRTDNVDEVLSLIREEVALVASEGVLLAELERVRQSAMGHLILGMESTRTRMSRMGSGEVTGGEILSANEVMDRFNAVTMSDIQRVAADVLTRDKALAVIGPFDESRFAASLS